MAATSFRVRIAPTPLRPRSFYRRIGRHRNRLRVRRAWRPGPPDGLGDPGGRTGEPLIDQPQELPPVSKGSRREEYDLEIDQPLAVGQPRLGLRALQLSKYLLDRLFPSRAVSVELPARLHHRLEVAPGDPPLPVVNNPRHPMQQGLEEVGVYVAPCARHQLVEPTTGRGERAGGESARAGRR